MGTGTNGQNANARETVPRLVLFCDERVAPRDAECNERAVKYTPSCGGSAASWETTWS